MKFAKIIKDLDPNMPVVISHGTNIIPEVAFLLDIVLDRPAPVVVTGSMRPRKFQTLTEPSTGTEFHLDQCPL